MRLLKFHIKNYKSITDSGSIGLSQNDNISVFAGQNESGKSSILGALADFENGKFHEETMPFSVKKIQEQSVSCTFQIDEKEDITSLLTEVIKDSYEIVTEENESILDSKFITKIKEFTLTRINKEEKVDLIISDEAFSLFCKAIKNKKIEDDKIEPYIVFSEEEKDKVAEIFWQITPRIILFDDFCDLLPDKIYVSKLKTEKSDTEGYKAVRNLETILDIDFLQKDTEGDAIRRTNEKKENKTLSIDFQKDWGQRIHDENEVTIGYGYEKRIGEGDVGSYINFYVETREGQPLPPKQRSKGLVWFLSLWMELKARDKENKNLILLLDEPDLHLHVKAQQDVLNLITRLAGDGKQIIYATHSPYLLKPDHLNRIKLVFNNKNDGTTIEDVVSSNIDTDNKRDALQPIADAIGIHLSEMSSLGEKNILLEGVSDFYYFTAMKKILKKKGNYNFIPGIGLRKINNLISLSIGYGFKWLAVIDDDPTTGGEDSIKKLNEIAEYIFDGDIIEMNKKVHVLKNIVGIENMFTFSDLKLVGQQINQKPNLTESVGKRRKILFSKLFYEKANAGKIKEANVSKKAKDNFKKVFNFIDKNL